MSKEDPLLHPYYDHHGYAHEDVTALVNEIKRLRAANDWLESRARRAARCLDASRTEFAISAINILREKQPKEGDQHDNQD